MKCQICGQEYKKVCSHAWSKHKIRARDYKRMFGFDVKRGLVSHEYKEHMRQLVFENGTIDNLQAGAAHRYKRGHTKSYQRSKQTVERLKKNWQRPEFRQGRKPIVQKVEITCARDGCNNTRLIYPRYLQEGNNFCSIRCANIVRNINRKSKP